MSATVTPYHLAEGRRVAAMTHSLDGLTVDPPIEERIARALADAEQLGFLAALAAIGDRVPRGARTPRLENALNELLAEVQA